MTSGGAEKLVVDLSRKYANLGYPTSVLSLSNKHTIFTDKLLAHEDIELLQPLRNFSVYNPVHIVRIMRILSRFDVVHVHLFPAFYWAGVASLFQRPRYLVYTEHNSNNKRRNSRLLTWADKFIYPLYHSIITISDAVDQSLRKHLDSLPLLPIHKIYNGINLSEINEAQPLQKEALGLLNEDKMILQVSSFFKQKNQSFLIRAMRYLDNSYKLLLVGEGPLLNHCQDLVKELELEDRVYFLGVRPDVPSLLKTADVVVLSSHYEGLSLSSVEGLASGAPFLASSVPGLIEVVGGAGILFPNGDESVLAAKINRCIEDADYRKEVIRKCLNRAKRYDQTDMAKAYLHLYSEYLMNSLALKPKKT